MRKAFVPVVVGIVLGLGLGLVWWFGWGCTRCAAGWDLWRFLVVFAGAGGAAGGWLTRDHPARGS